MTIMSSLLYSQKIIYTGGLIEYHAHRKQLIAVLQNPYKSFRNGNNDRLIKSFDNVYMLTKNNF